MTTTCFACGGFPIPELSPCGLCGATAEEGLPDPEVSAPTGGRPVPVLFGDVCDADAAELRDIAAWFDRQGKTTNGDFLRMVAARHEVLAGAYSTASSVRNAAFDFFAWYNKTYPTAPSTHPEHPWCVLGMLALERDKLVPNE